MPAISPTKLKLQSAKLADKYSQPEVFVRELHATLSLYVDNTHRPGKSGSQSIRQKTYHTPLLILRQILLYLIPFCETDSTGLLVLCDRLWGENCREHQLLACMLLGQLPLSLGEPIIMRLEKWASEATAEIDARALVEFGSARIRREMPSTILDLTAQWLQAPETSFQKLGLRSLNAIISDEKFSNLPAVYRLLTPLMRQHSLSTRADLLVLLDKLAVRFPDETAYTLQTLLQSSDNANTVWLTRQVLAKFSKETQKKLRTIIKEYAQRP